MYMYTRLLFRLCSLAKSFALSWIRLDKVVFKNNLNRSNSSSLKLAHRQWMQKGQKKPEANIFLYTVMTLKLWTFPLAYPLWINTMCTFDKDSCSVYMHKWLCLSAIVHINALQCFNIRDPKAWTTTWVL